MDTNLVLLWLVGASWVMGLPRAVQVARAGRPGWLAVYALLLFATGTAYLCWRPWAGAVGVSSFALLLMAPGIFQRRMSRLVGAQQYEQARNAARVVALLHPADGSADTVKLMAALATAQRGELDAAERALEELEAHGSAANRSSIRLYLYRLRGDYQGYLQLTDRVTDAELRQDMALFSGRLQALGELGRLDDMVATYARQAEALHAPAFAEARVSAQLYLAAFCGHAGLLQRLLSSRLSHLNSLTQNYWWATCEYAAGDALAGQARLQHALGLADPATARAIRARLDAPTTAASSRLSARSLELLAEIETDLVQEGRYDAAPPLAAVRVTAALIALNVLAFGLEELMGGSDRAATLDRVGALITAPAVPFVRAEAWRLLTALFLHAGTLHLVMNMMGLWALGPFVESWLGKARMLTVYLGSGLAGALWVALAKVEEPSLFLGASGCIMGLLGATAAILLHGFRAEQAKPAMRRLSRIAMVLGLQLTFDLSVPGISLAAHWLGVAVGFVIGYALMLSLPRAVR